MNSDNQLQNPKSRLTLRNARPQDVPGICDLSRRVYQGSGMLGYSHGAVRGQINYFPRGQFVVLVDDKVVGYCATFRVREKLALRLHSWVEITGNGYASRHDQNDDWLYDMEVCVDPVKNKKKRDPVLSFQLHNGFEILAVLPNYLPEARESLGYAVHLAW
jgi:hypothetical protein